MQLRPPPKLWSLNRLSSARTSLLMGVCTLMPPWGRCQLYRWGQNGSSAARRSELWYFRA